MCRSRPAMWRWSKQRPYIFQIKWTRWPCCRPFMWRTSAQRAKVRQYLGVWARVKRLWRTMLRFIRSFLNSIGELRGELRGDCFEVGDPHGEPPEDLGFSFMAWAVMKQLSSSCVSLMVPRFFELLQAGLNTMDIWYSLILSPETPGSLHKLTRGIDKVSNRNLVILQRSHIRLRIVSPNSWELLSSFDRHRHKCNHLLLSVPGFIYISRVRPLPMPKYGWMNYCEVWPAGAGRLRLEKIREERWWTRQRGGLAWKPTKDCMVGVKGRKKVQCIIISFLSMCVHKH